MIGPTATVEVGARCVECGAWVPWAELANETLCVGCGVEDKNSGMGTIEIGQQGGVSACVMDRVGGGWYEIDEDGYILPRVRWRDGAEHQAAVERKLRKREGREMELRRIRTNRLLDERDGEYVAEEARIEAAAFVEREIRHELDAAVGALNLREVEQYPERWPETFLRMMWVIGYFDDYERGDPDKAEAGLDLLRKAEGVLHRAKVRDAAGVIYIPEKHGIGVDETEASA